MTPYSEKEMEEISRDPARLRAYFWRVAMSARQRAADGRRRCAAQAMHSSPVQFDEVADKGRRTLRMASLDERLATAILDNIDALVASTVSRQ